MTLGQLRMQFASYAAGYGSVDSDPEARFHEFTLDDAGRWFSGRSDKVVDANNKYLRVVGSLAGEVDLVPSGNAGTAMEMLSRCSSVPSSLSDQVRQYEADQASAAKNLDVLVGQVRQLVGALGSYASGGSYVSGMLASQPWYGGLESSVSACRAWQGANRGRYGADLKAIKKDRKTRKDRERERQQREDDGKVEIFKAGLEIFIGGVTIFMTGGTAAPIVTALLGASMAMDVSDVIEGADAVSDGGRDVRSFNPIRDTLFQGHQGLYSGVETVTGLAAGGAGATRGALARIAGKDARSVTHVVAAARATGRPVALPVLNTVAWDVTSAAAINEGMDKVGDLIEDATGHSLQGRLAAVAVEEAGGKAIGETKTGANKFAQRQAGKVVWKHMGDENVEKVFAAVDWYNTHLSPGQEDAFLDLECPWQYPSQIVGEG